MTVTIAQIACRRLLRDDESKTLLFDLEARGIDHVVGYVYLLGFSGVQGFQRVHCQVQLLFDHAAHLQHVLS